MCRAQEDAQKPVKLLRLPCETRFAGQVTLMQDVVAAWDCLEAMMLSEEMKNKRDCDDTFFILWTVSVLSLRYASEVKVHH